MFRALTLALALFMFAGLAQADDRFAGLGIATGYNSGWFSPDESGYDVVRSDQMRTAALFTSRVSENHYLRMGSALAGTDAGQFFGQFGWRLNHDAAFFIGPELDYLNDESVDGYVGDAFAFGVSGSLDYAADPMKDRTGVVLQVTYGVTGLARDLTNVVTCSDTDGLLLNLGVGVAMPLFQKKN